jgi:transposase
MRPYSRDLCERIIEALEAQDGSQAEIAERFTASLSFVAKLWQRWRTTGSCAPWPHGGGRQRSLRGAEGLIRTELAEHPAMTLAALCERGAQAGHPQVTTKTMGLELKRLKLPLKKSRFTPMSATPSGCKAYARSLSSAAGTLPQSVSSSLTRPA